MAKQAANGGDENKADRPGPFDEAYTTGLLTFINETINNESEASTRAQPADGSYLANIQNWASSYQTYPDPANQQSQAASYQHQQGHSRPYVSPYATIPEQNHSAPYEQDADNAYSQDPGSAYAPPSGSSPAPEQEQDSTPAAARSNQALPHPTSVGPDHECPTDGHRYRKLTSTLEHMAWRCLLCGDGPLFEVWKCWKCDSFRCEPCAQYETTLDPAAEIL
ncbi:hypothetical protein DL546_009332 [Coniochaeta pulveracea]|uniref:Uncharacterized protein n=1 Tax=Coniochaeta pulveracea TaxID=177199 RepID=A0A420YHQ1_9PEZI|nr:hypothetical protein DL546_009332 [Coniochaeta pulveracea]